MVITGSPPFLLHFRVLNLVLRRRLIYRITDFHPECLMATYGRVPICIRVSPSPDRPAPTGRPLAVLGLDQARGCARSAFRGADRTQARPRTGHDHRPGASTSAPAVEGRRLLLYSGNWGVAHEIDTFVEGYLRHHRHGSRRMALGSMRSVPAPTRSKRACAPPERYSRRTQLVPRSAAAPARERRRPPDHPEGCVRGLCDAIEGLWLRGVAK